MELSTYRYPKLLSFLFVCALPAALNAAGGSAPSASAQAAAAPAAQSEAAVAASVATNPAAASPATTPALPAARAQPADTGAIFPNITPRWRKWELGVIADHARKQGWQPLPANSVRVVPYNMKTSRVGTAFQVDLKSGAVTVLSGQEDVPKIRSFTLQAPELDDLRKQLESKPFADLAVENQTIGTAGQSLLVEAEWKGEYRWRLYWGETPFAMQEIEKLLNKAYVREH